MIELKDIYDMVQDGMKILSDSAIPLSDFGYLLDKTWQAKKKLSSAISSGSIDEMYEIAMRSGAFGGKLLGAGGGGFFLFYVDGEKEEFRKKMSKFVEIPFQFEGDGSKIIYLN